LFKGVGLARLAAGEIGHIDEMLSPCAAEFARLATRWVLVFSDDASMYRWRTELETAGLRFARTGCWAKPDPMPQMTGDRPGVGFEPCTICHAPGPMRWNGGGKPALWIYPIAKGHARPDHPCPKPLPLMRTLVEQFTDPGDVVLDPFMGSGTTGVACKELGRSFIGIELNPDYFAIAKTRIEAARYRPELVFTRTKRRKEEVLL
jgi:site-specific DNA-methyltransferase (adenine-specific)